MSSDVERGEGRGRLGQVDESGGCGGSCLLADALGRLGQRADVLRVRLGRLFRRAEDASGRSASSRADTAEAEI